MAASTGAGDGGNGAFLVGLIALVMAVLQALAAAGRLPGLNFWPFVRSENKMLRWAHAAWIGVFAVIGLIVAFRSP
jgi:hypothetical protein